MSCGSRTNSAARGCGRPSRDKFKSIDDLLNDFARVHRGRNQATIRAYKGLSDEEALKKAALLEVIKTSGYGWKRHPHFHRSWFYTEAHKNALKKASLVLLKNKPALVAAKARGGFNEVHAEVAKVLADIRGVKDLAFYDITELLGYAWGFEPTDVLLHAGTRKGAEALFGSSHCRRAKLGAEQVAGRFGDLRPAEIEDFLCIYANEIEGLRSRRWLPEWSYR